MQTIENNSKRVAARFSDKWEQYLEVVSHDVLFHSEMFAALDTVLAKRFTREFTLADFGCGDASAIVEILKKRSVSRYVGVDAARSLIERAHQTLAQTTFEKQLVVGDMRVAIKDLDAAVDVIMSSYAMHHLDTDDKMNFIAEAYSKLRAGGLLIVIDGVIPAGQDRDAYLRTLEGRLRTANPAASEEEIADRMEHPRLDDFPDSIATLTAIAERSGFASWEVVIDKGIFAMLVMTKAFSA